MNSWFGQVLIGLDQLGNALCGGYADVTISARLGYTRDRHTIFAALAGLVDFAFRPVESQHCYRAWIAANADFERLRRGNDVAMVLLAILVIPFILPLFLVNAARWLFLGSET